jgi:alpha-L-fucosidase
VKKNKALKILFLFFFVATNLSVANTYANAYANVYANAQTNIHTNIHANTQNKIQNKLSQTWEPVQTAIIVCDMWDKHWCDGATARVKELAPALNEMLNAARKKGVTIIHAPSECMKFYKDFPQRKILYNNKLRKNEIAYDDTKFTNEPTEYPIEFWDECDTESIWGNVWTRQISTINIDDSDGISDSGAEIAAYFKKKGIKNVILCGVHTNMCILNRSFGLRAMKKRGFNVALMSDMTDVQYNPALPPYTTHFGGLNLMIDYIEKYICPTVTSSYFTEKSPFVFNGEKQQAEAVAKDRARGIYLPESDYHLWAVSPFVENNPDNDYLHASDSAYEAFKDIKFSIRIHWGIYSIWQMNGESWGFLDLSSEKKQQYNNLYKSFNPTKFNADEWMDFFKRSGLQTFAFTTKHHEGFSMFDTKTRIVQRANYENTAKRIGNIEQCDLAYSIMETPFGRDIVKELTEAAHRNSIKIDLYFSHPDWYDADFRPYNGHPLTTLTVRDNILMYGNDIEFDSTKIITPERTEKETSRMIARHREQLRELLTNYGKIDMLCLDQWLGADVWNETKATVKMVRKLQPDIMIRARGIGNYGDYYTPERFIPGNPENTAMPWMVIYPLGSSFSYDKDSANYKGAYWIIENLVDAVAKGGSFMVGIGPDGTGVFHPEAIRQLEHAGKWLQINGEGIYNTRARKIWNEGDIRFTQSKDGHTVYAFIKGLPATSSVSAMLEVSATSENEIILNSIDVKAGMKISILGYDKSLQYSFDKENVLKITIPDDIVKISDKNINIWTLKITDM